MKINCKILIIPIIVIFYSCNETQKNVDVSSVEITEFETDLNKNVVSKTNGELESHKIIGKFYVDSFYRYLKKGFELQIKRPEEEFGLYSFEFKKDGKVIFEDLTEFYVCGNGILSIENGNWKSKENGIYELTFDGEYSLESKFHTVSEYKLVALKNGNFKMQLIKVIENNKNLAWD